MNFFKVLIVFIVVAGVTYIQKNAVPDTKVITDKPGDCGFTKPYKDGFLANNQYKCNPL